MSTVAGHVRTPTRAKGLVWMGRVFTALPILMLLLSATLKLTKQPQMVETFTGRLGYAASALAGLGLLEVACVVLYAIPSTAVLGAVLLTGFLGGAIATHVRVGDPSFLVPLFLGVLVWAGIYFRDERLGWLLPLRRSASRPKATESA